MLVFCINCKKESHIDRDPAKGGRPREYCDECRRNIILDANAARARDRYWQARKAGASSPEAASLARQSNARFQAGIEALLQQKS